MFGLPTVRLRTGDDSLRLGDRFENFESVAGEFCMFFRNVNPAFGRQTMANPFFEIAFSIILQIQTKFVAVRRRNQHARRARYPFA